MSFDGDGGTLVGMQQVVLFQKPLSEKARWLVDLECGNGNLECLGVHSLQPRPQRAYCGSLTGCYNPPLYVPRTPVPSIHTSTCLNRSRAFNTTPHHAASHKWWRAVITVLCALKNMSCKEQTLDQSIPLCRTEDVTLYHVADVPPANYVSKPAVFHWHCHSGPAIQPTVGCCPHKMEVVFMLCF